MKDLFKTYRSKIVKEGLLKSLLIGLIVGSAALFLCGFFSWFFGFREGLFLGVGLFAALTAALTPAIYFLRYRPTAKSVARRIDELGLEERVLTMLELEHDDSFIASVQRADTMRALGKLNSMLLKIAISVWLVVCFAVALLLGFGGATVNSLYYAEVIPSGMELLAEHRPLRDFVVEYSVESRTEGRIVLWDDDWGEPVSIEDSYTVTEGDDMPAVFALNNGAWNFVGWSDGLMTAYRRDTDILRNYRVTALYEEVVDEEPPEDDPVEGESGGSGGSGQGDGGSSDTPPPEGGNPSSSDSTSRNDENQQIIDGQTYYGDNYASAYGDAMDRLGSDPDIPDDLKQWVSDYYDSIQKHGDGDPDDSGDGGSGETNP